jgi:hypothetical protein
MRANIPARPTIKLNVPGAADQQLERGVEAAWKVLEAAHVHAYAAAASAFKLESLGGHSLTPEQEEWAKVWHKAVRAAIDAACEGLPSEPPGCDLQLLWPRRPTGLWRGVIVPLARKVVSALKPGPATRPSDAAPPAPSGPR